MSMFENYKNLNPEYAPNNQSVSLPKCEHKLELTTPKTLLNYWGEPIGYKWNAGDIFNLSINLSTAITIESDDIVYATTGEAPTDTTKGEFGQSIYNIVDMRRWVCTSIGQSVYKWQEQIPFSYPIHASKLVYLQDVKEYIGKTLILSILNFRGDIIYEREKIGNEIISLDVDNELSDILIPGLYKACISYDGDAKAKIIKTLSLEVIGRGGEIDVSNCAR